MLAPIYHKPYIEQYTKAYRVGKDFKKILERGVIDSHLFRHPISPAFFESSDDKFLEIINSEKFISAKKREITYYDE